MPYPSPLSDEQPLPDALTDELVNKKFVEHEPILDAAMSELTTLI